VRVMESITYALSTTLRVSSPTPGTITINHLPLVQGCVISGFASPLCAYSVPTLARCGPFRVASVRPRRALATEILNAGIASGELKSDIDVNVAIDALYGRLYYRFLIPYAPLSPKYARALADDARVGGVGGCMPSINRLRSAELEGADTKNKGVHSEGLSGV
jgi:hypothetical protein